MAQDITQKQQQFTAQHAAQIRALATTVNALTALNAQWSANGYAAGAPTIDGTDWIIPDGPVQSAVPGATAAALNTAVGATTSVIATYNSNLGYLVPFLAT